MTSEISAELVSAMTELVGFDEVLNEEETAFSIGAIECLRSEIEERRDHFLSQGVDEEDARARSLEKIPRELVNAVIGVMATEHQERYNSNRATAVAKVRKDLGQKSLDLVQFPNDSLPKIAINDYDLAVEAPLLVERIESLIQEDGTNPRLLLFERELVRVETDSLNKPRILGVGRGSIFLCAAEVSNFYYRPQGNNPPTRAEPPTKLMQTVEELLPDSSLPRLRGIVFHPILVRAGSGYSLEVSEGLEESGYWHSYDQSISTLMEGLTRDTALSALEDLFYDFPFDGDGGDLTSRRSFWATLAGALSPIVFPAVGCNSPLFVVSKPKAGTGATLLVKIIWQVICGFDATGLPPSENEEEFKKTLLSEVRENVPLVFYDNVERLTSNTLAAFLTSGSRWAGRMLGHTRQMYLPKMQQVWATGNHVVLNKDLTSRTIYIHLDAKMADPTKRRVRKMRHHNIMKYAESRRLVLLASLLKLVENWIEKDQPPPPESWKMQRYDEWSHCVLGILRAAGCEVSPIADAADRLDESTHRWQGFFQTWYNNGLARRPEDWELPLASLVDFWESLDEPPVAFFSNATEQKKKSLVGTWIGRNCGPWELENGKQIKAERFKRGSGGSIRGWTLVEVANDD